MVLAWADTFAEILMGMLLWRGKISGASGAIFRWVVGDQLVYPGSIGSVKNDVSVTPPYTPKIRITPWSGRC
jgi:hypothetical protein